ncbi:MAG: hypothetical protein KatS3mg131_1469 [Candidatus Tectimicrobiota bacterium]|nr:MAG: hypothetical protein KatS3mg131_1469 [Candidatus Tectomicrobia bacterium]
MTSSCRFAWLLLVASLLWALAVGAQAPPPAQEAAPAGPVLEGPLRPETLAARRTALQARLAALAQATLPKEELDATRAALEQQLKVLAALEEAFARRATYEAQLKQLPQRLAELQAQRQALEAQPPPRFTAVTEALREQYEAQLQAVRAELEQLSKQNAAGELRLAGIAKELEQLAQERAQLEKDLLAARADLAKAGEQRASLLARVELLDLQVQLRRAQAAALEAEREWLTKRGPLQDALLAVAQVRLQALQRDLDTIKQALGQALRREQAQLSTAAQGIERQLEQAADPAEALALAVQLETVEIRKATAAYRQQLNRVGDQVLAQEKLNLQEKQDVERLTSLVEKYASGERVAQRLHLAFTRLRRERERFRDDLVKSLEAELQALTEKALELDDRLYEFDRQVEVRLQELLSQLGAMAPEKREARLARVREAFAAQKAALREQQQVLATLTQDLTKLITLHRERKRLLDDSYRFILTKLFWLRDGQPLRSAVVEAALRGALSTAARLRAFVHAELTTLLASLLRSLRFWLLLPTVFVLLPWLALRLRRWLRARVRAYIDRDMRQQAVGYRVVSALLMLLQTTVWPTYIAVVVWIWPQVLPASSAQPELESALIAGLQLGALLLWFGLLGHALFRREGWGQQYLGLGPELCRFLQRLVRLVTLAALLFLVPRQVLLAAPGEGELAVASLALARCFFLAFQLVLLAVAIRAGRRRSPLLQAMLARSQAQNGLLWRNWPLLHVLLVLGIVAIIALDVQGYRYAARSLWLRSAEALGVVFLLMAVYSALGALIDRLARQRRRLGERPLDPTQPSRWSLLQQGRQFLRFVLVLLGLVIVQHLYGLDQDLFAALDAVTLFAIGTGDAGQPLWLTLGDVLKVAAILGGATLLVRNLPGLCEVLLFPRLQWDAGLRYAFLTLSRYAVVLAALWWSLAELHLRWSSIQWIIAAASVGLGFGLQEIVSNFVSGLILLIERPISVGDFVAVGGQEGTVTRITIRATTIQNLDNQTVIIPNKEFIAGQVINWTLGDTYVRVTLKVGVAYGSDMELVRRLLTDAVSTHPKVLRYPPPQVLFRGFGDSSLDWQVWFFVPTPRERFSVAHDVLLAIDRAFRQHGVQIPFPQRDLHLRSADVALAVRPLGNAHEVSPVVQTPAQQPPTP